MQKLQNIHFCETIRRLDHFRRIDVKVPFISFYSKTRWSNNDLITGSAIISSLLLRALPILFLVLPISSIFHSRGMTTSNRPTLIRLYLVYIIIKSLVRICDLTTSVEIQTENFKQFLFKLDIKNASKIQYTSGHSYAVMKSLTVGVLPFSQKDIADMTTTGYA